MIDKESMLIPNIYLLRRQEHYNFKCILQKSLYKDQLLGTNVRNIPYLGYLFFTLSHHNCYVITLSNYQLGVRAWV